MNPTRAPADRDLLAGVLAVRLGLVPREAMARGPGAGPPLDDGPGWMERSGLEPGRRSWLESLAAEHLRIHGSDLARSLEALGLDAGSHGLPDDRAADPAGPSIDALDAATVDPGSNRPAVEIPETLCPKGLSVAAGADDLYATALPTSTDRWIPVGTDQGPPEATGPGPRARGRRYRNIRPHARGGLGAVFLAEDLELRREVALKEIKDLYADHPEHRARFLLEAEVTGCLEHPGIVPIYGLGQDLDGRPYYAMRFIEGESLRDAIVRHREAHGGPGADPAARALSLRKLVGHFGGVCQAMAYAHSRGVIHRDLKPDNVMLGAYGETLVVDWGVAKPMGRCFPQDDDAVEVAPARPSRMAGHDPLSAETQVEPPAAEPGSGPGPGPDDSRSGPGRTIRPLVPTGQAPGQETVAGSAIGTPSYMPPEQARGDLDRLGPCSDIYSLGATLYSILAGRPPFVDRDFETMAGKIGRGDFPPPRAVDPHAPAPLEAIALKAMAVEPVDRYRTARALGEDVERWLADEPVSAYPEPWPDRARRWARRHRTAVGSAAALLLTAVIGLAIGATLLERERARTDRERRVALRNYHLAYDAADRMLGEVAEFDLADIPQMEPVRRRLLETARARFAELLDQQSGDPEVALLAGRTRSRLGGVLAMMGQHRRAEASFREALQGLEAIAPKLPGDPRPALELAQAHRGLGVLLRKSNRSAEAETHLRAAIGGLESASTAVDREARKGLTDSRYQLGALLARRGRRDPEQERAYRRAIDDQERLIAEGGDGPGPAESLARYRNNLAILESRGRPAQAERQFRAILGALAKLDRPVAGLPGARWQEGRASNNLATLLMRDPPRADGADPLLESARTLLETLTAEFPRIPQYRRELAQVDANRGRRALAKGRPDDAARLLDDVAGRLARLADEEPEIPDDRQLLAVTLSDIALLHARTAPDRAEADFERAQAVLEGLAGLYPDVPEYRNALGRSLYDLARIRADRGQPARALPPLERAIGHHEATLKVDDRDDVARANLFEDRALLMIVALRLDDLDRAADLAEAGPATLPDRPEAYLRGAAGLAACSARASQSRRPELAGGYVDRAARLLRLGFDRGVLAGAEVFSIAEFAPLAGRDAFEALRREIAASPGASIPHSP